MIAPGEILDVVIIGRGFAGLSLAVELAKNGNARIEVIHDEDNAYEASSAAHGISTIKGIFEADSDLFSKKIEGHRGFDNWLQHLESLTGSTRPPGVLRLGVSESFRTIQDFSKDFGRIYRKDFVGVKNVTVDFSVTDAFARAFYPADFWINPHYLLGLLVEACNRLGVRLTAGRVLRIKPENGRSDVVLGPDRTIRARCTVICAGAGTHTLIPAEGLDALGQVFAVAGTTFKSWSNQAESCEVKGTAGVISVGGCVFWGSTSEPSQAIKVGASPGKPPSRDDQISAGKKILSKLSRGELAEKDIRTNWGVRVRTRTRYPFVGCVEARSNIWVSTGFYKSGITLCWLFSRDLAKDILKSLTISGRRVTSSR